MRFVQLTDLHLDPDEPTPRGVDVWGRARWAVSSIAATDPDCVIVTGDLALHRGTRRIYNAVRDLLAPLPADVLFLPGNHDDRTLFSEVFGRRYRVHENYPWLDRTVTVAGTTVVLLDSGDGRIEPPQLRWLSAVVHAHAAAARRGEAPMRLTVWTHHPLITGFHRYMDGNYPLANAEEVLTVLDGSRGDLPLTVLCGHYHAEDRRRRDGIEQLTTPAVYVQIDPEPEGFVPMPDGPGYRILDLAADGTAETAVVYGQDGG